MQAVRLERVNPQYLDLYWSRVERALDWQVSRSPYAAGLLRSMVKAGTRDLWTAPHGRFPAQLSSVIVTTIMPHPRLAPVLRAELVSGRHVGTWIASAAQVLTAYAQAHGCTRIYVIGRKGWRHYRDLFAIPVTWATDESAQDADHHRQIHHHQ